MNYFEAFPTIAYRFSNTEDPILLTHILRRFSFRQKVKDIVSIWDSYIVAENETPEMVAYKVYGDSSYHWIILLFNDIIDPFTDWVMSDDVLNSYINKKYTYPMDVHHYALNGRVVPQGTEGALPATNYEYETMVNEAKRKIRIPHKGHLLYINKELESILKETR